MKEENLRNALTAIAPGLVRSVSAGATPQTSAAGHVLSPHDRRAEIAANSQCQIIPFQAIDDTLERLLAKAERFENG